MKLRIPKSKPKKFGMEEIQQKIINKKLSNRYIHTKNDNRIFNVLLEDYKLQVNCGNKTGYSNSRTYFDYNLLLNSVYKTKTTILERIATYAKLQNKKVIKVLDDGAGKGNFLGALKKIWKYHTNKNHIKTKLETNAIVLNSKEVNKTNQIDNIYSGDISEFNPKQKFDFIFSVYGATTYTITELRTEVFLKHLYSLEKGGYGFFSTPIEINNDKMNQIILNLKKRGFIAKYHDLKNDFSLNEKNQPTKMIVIQRIK